MSIQREHQTLTLDDVYRLIERGSLRGDERIELIDGEIVQMAAMGADHVECVFLFTYHLDRMPRQTWYVSVQNAIRLAPDYAPQPDLALIRQRVYHGALPAPDDIFLIIEVSDTTLQYDRFTKLPLYAAAGIPEVWIADVKRYQITRYSEPDPTGYRVVRPFPLGETITSLVLPTISLPVAAVFASAPTTP
jgi:Uma2 family endonuclease